MSSHRGGQGAWRKDNTKKWQNQIKKHEKGGWLAAQKSYSL